jgi:hypothetical protein
VDNVGFDKTISKDASTDDTLALIVHTANVYSKGDYAMECAKHLCPNGTPRAACLRNIFDYYCRNVVYKLDPKGTEKVYTPNRTIIEGAGDCKKAATFLGSVLLASGIEPIFKHVYYDNNDQYTHIYVIVGTPDNYITLDPTNGCNYNKEVKYKHANLYFTNGRKMELKQMGATDSPHQQSPSMVAGIDWNATCGSMNNDISAISDNMLGATKRPVHHLSHAAVMNKIIPNKPHLKAALKNIPVANQRGAFLTLIEHNYNGLATNLAAALGHDPHALDKVWKEVGGDLAHLKGIVLKGATKPAAHETSVSSPQYIGFSFKKFLHAAAAVIHVVAAVVSVIYPPAAAILNKVADKCEDIATNAPVDIQIHDKNIDRALPPDPTGVVIKNPNQNFHGGKGGHGHHVGSFNSIGGFIFKSVLLISILNINQDLKNVLGTVALLAPFVYLVVKNYLTKWTLKNV